MPMRLRSRADSRDFTLIVKLAARPKSGLDSQKSAEHDLRMKQGARDASGDGYKVALSAKDLHVAGVREVGQVHCLSVANASGNFVGCGNGGQCWQQRARMDEKIIKS